MTTTLYNLPSFLWDHFPIKIVLSQKKIASFPFQKIVILKYPHFYQV